MIKLYYEGAEREHKYKKLGVPLSKCAQRCHSLAGWYVVSHLFPTTSGSFSWTELGNTYFKIMILYWNILFKLVYL